MSFALATALLWASPCLAREPGAAISSSTVDTPYDLVSSSAPQDSSGTLSFFPESLEYEVKWGIFSVGTSDLRIEHTVRFGGAPAFHATSSARSNRFCDNFYPVRDLNESWISVADLRSLAYSKKLNEGKFHRDEWVVYDYSRKAFLSKRIDKDGSVTWSTGTVPGAVQDILSSLVFIRPAPLKVGDELVLDVNTRQNWPLAVKVLRRETIEMASGRYSCVLVEPFLRQEGIFVQKGKRLQIWLTDDSRHMPVLMRVDVPFGSITAYLIRATPPYSRPKK